MPKMTSGSTEPKRFDKKHPSTAAAMYSAPNTGSSTSASAKRICTAPKERGCSAMHSTT